MNLLSSLVDAPALSALAAALLHFVWQGAAMALLLAVWFKWGRPSSHARYTAGVVTLAAMLVAPLVTFAWIAGTERVQSTEVAPDPRTLAPRSGGAPDPTRIEVGPEPLSVTSASAPFGRITPAVQSAVLVVWFAGVVALSVRLFGGWVVARRLATQAVQPASAELLVLARRIAGRMALDRAVSVLESSRVRVPVIVGWLKPVVLFPAATLSSLSPAQIEAILAHELAHIRRHDYLVNLMQSAVETLLFYHPAVWWVSRQVRAEREHCCDDVAVEVCDRLVYVSALSDLARMTTAHGAALAATDGSLVRRVRRLLGADSSTDPERPGSLPVLTLIVLGAIALPVVLTSRVAATPPATADLGATAVVGASASEPQHQPATGNFAVVLPAGATPSGTVASVQPPAAPEVQTASTIERQVQAELEARRQKLQDLEVELAKLARARSQLEQRQIENESQSRLAELMVELEALKRERGRRADMVAVGTLSPTALNELEKELAVMELKMKSARAELEVRRSDGDLRMREEELKREIEVKMYEMQNTEYRKALENQQLWKTRGGSPTEDPAVFHQWERTTREQMAMAVSIEVTAPTETIRVDDILIIEIQGEPDLPRAYVVQADGTIRLPLVGALAVQKLTAAQAKEGVQKLLAKYRIEAATGVDVRLRRPRR